MFYERKIFLGNLNNHLIYFPFINTEDATEDFQSAGKNVGEGLLFASWTAYGPQQPSHMWRTFYAGAQRASA